MQQPGGMTPGASSLAHARAFRFAAALRGAGYRVSEAPLGPRGGRRFTLDGYDGPRCGAIYRLQTHRGCSFWHRREECGCFADLSDQELSLVATLHRKIKKTSGTIYTTDRSADLVRTQDETALRTAVDLYVRADTALMGGPDLETYLFLLEGCPTDTLRLAIGLFKAAGGTRRGGPTVSDYVGLLGRYDLDTLQAAVHLFLSSEGSGDGLPFADLIAALQAARS